MSFGEYTPEQTETLSVTDGNENPITALIFARTETDVWMRHVWSKASSDTPGSKGISSATLNGWGKRQHHDGAQ